MGPKTLLPHSYVYSYLSGHYGMVLPHANRGELSRTHCECPLYDVCRGTFRGIKFPSIFFLFLLSFPFLCQNSLEEPFDRYYQSEMDKKSLPYFLEDDSELRKTKANTWTLGILRGLRNSLTKFLMTWVLMTWESFDTDQSTSFDLDAVGTPYNNFRESYSHIKRNIVELRAV